MENLSLYLAISLVLIFIVIGYLMDKFLSKHKM